MTDIADNPALREFAQKLRAMFGGRVYLIGSCLKSQAPRDIDMICICDLAKLETAAVKSVRLAPVLFTFILKEPAFMVDVKLMEEKTAERHGFLKEPKIELSERS